MKKLFCIIITLCLLFGLTGCNDTTDTNSDSQGSVTSTLQSNVKQSINLLYSYSDSLNPYTAATSANRELSSLLYDSLIKTDNNFNAVYVLAQKAETVDKTCTVVLRDATFTDGSVVTSDDVIYSYNIAKESSRYLHKFYEVQSVLATDSKTIVFNLSQCDAYFINLLDFPIIKSGTSGTFDADGKEIMPIGCGRYYISQDGQSFNLNENYYGKIGNIKTIHLINSPDSTSTTHYVEIGAASTYYTEGDNIVRMSGKKTTVNLNRLIYIGINSTYGSLQTKEMRYAISSALNRDAICQTAYYNNAVPAEGFFNPCFEATRALQTIESKPNTKIIVENLAKIGYNNMNSNGFYANSAGNNPVFTLLVNSENSSRVAAANAIAAQCKSAGIQIQVVECTYAQYVERLSSGGFQLYLGEVQVPENMDFSQLVVPGGRAAYGVYDNAQPQISDQAPDSADTPLHKNSCAQILASYNAGTCGINDVAGTLLTEMPQIPVCYLNGVLFYDSAIRGGIEASSSDIFLTIQNYEF